MHQNIYDLNKVERRYILSSKLLQHKSATQQKLIIAVQQG